MADWLASYTLFLAKLLTVLAGLGALGMALVGAARRGGPGPGEDIEVTHLNERYERMRRRLEEATRREPRTRRLRERLRLGRRRAGTRADGQDPPPGGEPGIEGGRGPASPSGGGSADASGAGPDRAPDRDSGKETGTHRGKGSPGELPRRRRIFVLDFEGDIRASNVRSLREEVTAILTLARAPDEVLVRLENAGGLVHGHGLAASQLARIKDQGLRLSVAVDKVAASGGYLMACVADRILAAPFAIVGSIGVLAQIPNFHELLKRHGVEVEQFKAGPYKRTVTLFGQVTEGDRAKLREELEALHALFKEFVITHRPGLDLDRVATGEHWHGARALELGLVDEVTTSDARLLEASREAELYHVRYRVREGVLERLGHTLRHALGALRAAAPEDAPHERIG